MVRVWSPPPRVLDNRRLLGEHQELHTIVSVLLSTQEIANAQGVTPDKINWDQIRLGWRSHPQVTRWHGKIGAVIERHDIVAKEMFWRKRKKTGENAEHQSPMEKQILRLSELDPSDNSYGTLKAIVRTDPQREIIDLRHLLEKWDKDEEKGRPPKGHNHNWVKNRLIQLVGPAQAARMIVRS